MLLTVVQGFTLTRLNQSSWLPLPELFWELSSTSASGCCVCAQSLMSDCDPKDCSLPGFSVHWDSPGKNTGVDCHALIQVSNLCLSVSLLAGGLFTTSTTWKASKPVNDYHTKNPSSKILHFKRPELEVCFHDGREYVSYGLSQPDSIELKCL